MDPGSYAAILRGKGGATGIGVVQAYDLNQAAQSKFGNIATRGFINSGDNVMIGGFVIGQWVELHDGNGAVIAFNDNWKDDTNQKSIPRPSSPPINARARSTECWRPATTRL